MCGHARVHVYMCLCVCASRACMCVFVCVRVCVWCVFVRVRVRAPWRRCGRGRAAAGGREAKRWQERSGHPHDEDGAITQPEQHTHRRLGDNSARWIDCLMMIAIFMQPRRHAAARRLEVHLERPGNSPPKFEDSANSLTQDSRPKSTSILSCKISRAGWKPNGSVRSAHYQPPRQPVV